MTLLRCPLFWAVFVYAGINVPIEVNHTKRDAIRCKMDTIRFGIKAP